MAVLEDAAVGQDSTEAAGATDQASGATAQTDAPKQASKAAAADTGDTTGADVEVERVDPAAFQKLQSDLAKLNRELEKTRKEAASRRVEAGEKEKALDDLRKQVARSLGLEVEDQATDPKALAAQIDELKGKYRAERLSNAFERVARKHEVDPELALAWLTLKGELADLDVEDKGLEAELAERITSAKERNPRLSTAAPAPVKVEEKKAKPAPAIETNAAEVKGGAANDAPLTRAMLSKMTPAEINANYERIAAAIAAGTLK